MAVSEYKKTIVFIPDEEDYQRGVDTLLEMIAPWGLGCYTGRDSETGEDLDRGQLIIDSKTQMPAILTSEQRGEIMAKFHHVRLIRS